MGPSGHRRRDRPAVGRPATDGDRAKGVLVSLTRLAVLGAALALLSGCAGATPGVAVRVGDESITVNEVDELTANYCEAVEDQLTGGGQVVPLRFFRGGLAGVL